MNGGGQKPSLFFLVYLVNLQRYALELCACKARQFFNNIATNKPKIFFLKNFSFRY